MPWANLLAIMLHWMYWQPHGLSSQCPGVQWVKRARTLKPVSRDRGQQMCQRVWVCSTVLLFLLFGASFMFTTSSDSGGQVRRRPPRRPVTTSDDSDKGLQFRLSEGAEQPEHRTPVGPVRATRLPESDTQSLLQRLKPIKQDPSD